MAVTVGIASGKGGVGKTTVTILLGLTSAFRRKKTLIVDTDVGMGNVNIMLGVGYKHSLVDCLSKGIELDKALVKLGEKGFNHLDVIPSGNLDDRMFTYSRKTAAYFLSRLGGLIRKYELVIFDLGAGVNNFLLNIFSSVDYPVLVVNPEPPSMVDAYSLMKLTHMIHKVEKFNFVANRTGKKDFEKVKKILEALLISKFSIRCGEEYDIFEPILVVIDECINEYDEELLEFVEFLKELKKKIINLKHFPYKYRKSFYFDDENIRDLIFKGYTIIYKLTLRISKS